MLTTTQTDGLLQLATPLNDNLVLVSLKGREAVSEAFWFDIEFLCEHSRIVAADLIAKPLTVGIECDSGRRYINGVVSEFTVLSAQERWARYKVRIVPWLWFLTRTSDCAIYQNQSVPEIISAVFAKYGLSRYEARLVRDYPKREFCVQYRETACDFVKRLLEEEGISFFFRHEESSHCLVMVDHVSCYSSCALPGGAVRWEPAGGPGFLRDSDYVFDWERRCEVRPRAWTQIDYDFSKPHFPLGATAPSIAPLRLPDFERFDYPGRFQTLKDAEVQTRLHIEQEEAALDTTTGRSYCRTFTAGHVFTLADHFRKDQNGKYLLTSVEHETQQGGTFAGTNDSRNCTYSNKFTCVPATAIYRPPRVTPRPVISGPQTAFVTGPKGEEIHTDKYGRVKVRFHWDRSGREGDNSSCWVRVSQTLAGKGWGSVQLPRVGQEVIVEFLDGDPDRPLVTGRVYNAEQMPPYDLPREKTRTTLKTRSSPGGGGFNELRFEDAKGKEQIFMHAQRDFDLRVGNDALANVGRSSHCIVGKDQILQVKRDQHITVEGDQMQKINATVSIEAGADWHQKVASGMAVEAGSEIHLKAGRNIVIESGTTLTLKVGDSFIHISPTGIFIKGKLVMINSGGAPGAGRPASPVSPSLPSDADTARPGEVAKPLERRRPAKPVVWSQQALAMKRASERGSSICEFCNR